MSPMWTAERLLAALEMTAVKRAQTHGHRLGKWDTAKRKMGQGARRALCMTCGKPVFLTPHGYGKARNRAAQREPGIHGDALFEPCVYDLTPERDTTMAGRLR